MSVKLTTHFLPEFDEGKDNPVYNNNLFLTTVDSDSTLTAPITLQGGEEYFLNVNIKNEGTDSERAVVNFFFIEEEASIQIGEQVVFTIGAGETRTEQSTIFFTPNDKTSYQLYAVVQGRNDRYNEMPPNPADRHVAWQSAFAGIRNVELTLHDGFGNGDSIGNNPNVFMLDAAGMQVSKPRTGEAYKLNARVVNNGHDADAANVSFYTKNSNIPIGITESAIVEGKGGEYIFSLEGFVYEHGKNQLVAVCSTISEADQYKGKNMKPSDRHIGQFNVHQA